MESSLKETLVTHPDVSFRDAASAVLGRYLRGTVGMYMKYVPNTRNFLQVLAGWLASG